MEKIIIDEIEYPFEVVKAFCATEGHDFGLEYLQNEVPDKDLLWHQVLMRSHLETFHTGWQAGYESAMEDIPDCDNCDVHGKAAEAGPPESHYSQQDR